MSTAFLKVDKIPHYEMVRRVISPELKGDIIRALELAGFNVGKQGHIEVADIQPGHPDRDGRYLPVGFLGTGYACLVNLDEKFPQDYHGKLRKILGAP